MMLVDDCYGAVAVSPLMASGPQNSAILAQIESDFTAGLADPDPENRIISIQRLGGLRSTSARPALHDVIEQGDSIEKDWATYAALRTGDTTVLPRVRQIRPRRGGLAVAFSSSRANSLERQERNSRTNRHRQNRAGRNHKTVCAQSGQRYHEGASLYSGTRRLDGRQGRVENPPMPRLVERDSEMRGLLSKTGRLPGSPSLQFTLYLSV